MIILGKMESCNRFYRHIHFSPTRLEAFAAQRSFLQKTKKGKKIKKRQECIPVGCITPASVAIRPAHPLPRMPPCHAALHCHACPPGGQKE